MIPTWVYWAGGLLGAVACLLAVLADMDGAFPLHPWLAKLPPE